MTRVRHVSLGFAALALCVATNAHADVPGDAWAAAKGVLPASPLAVIGGNVGTIKSSTIFQQLTSAALAQSSDAKQKLDQLKADCNIDVKDAVQGFVVAFDEAQKGVVFVSLKGVDPIKINECITKVSIKEKKPVTIGKPDAQGIVEYSGAGKLYVAFLPKSVIAIATEPKDKAQLQKWISDKGIDSKTELGRALANVNTNAALWGAAAKSQKLEEGMNMKAVYGSADLASGTLSADVRVVLANAKEATDATAKAIQGLEDAKKGNQIPPHLAGLAKSIKISAQGPELQVKGSMPEAEVLGLIGMMTGKH